MTARPSSNPEWCESEYRNGEQYVAISMAASGHAYRGGKKYATYSVGSTRIGPRYESTPPLTQSATAMSGWNTTIAEPGELKCEPADTADPANPTREERPVRI